MKKFYGLLILVLIISIAIFSNVTARENQLTTEFIPLNPYPSQEQISDCSYRAQIVAPFYYDSNEVGSFLEQQNMAQSKAIQFRSDIDTAIARMNYDYFSSEEYPPLSSDIIVQTIGYDKQNPPAVQHFLAINDYSNFPIIEIVGVKWSTNSFQDINNLLLESNIQKDPRRAVMIVVDQFSNPDLYCAQTHAGKGYSVFLNQDSATSDNILECIAEDSYIPTIMHEISHQQGLGHAQSNANLMCDPSTNTYCGIGSLVLTQAQIFTVMAHICDVNNVLPFQAQAEFAINPHFVTFASNYGGQIPEYYVGDGRLSDTEQCENSINLICPSILWDHDPNTLCPYKKDMGGYYLPKQPESLGENPFFCTSAGVCEPVIHSYPPYLPGDPQMSPPQQRHPSGAVTYSIPPNNYCTTLCTSNTMCDQSSVCDTHPTNPQFQCCRSCDTSQSGFADQCEEIDDCDPKTIQCIDPESGQVVAEIEVEASACTHCGCVYPHPNCEIGQIEQEV